MLDARIVVVIFIGLLIGGIVLASGTLQPAGWTTDGEIQGKHGFQGRMLLNKRTYASTWQTNENSETITCVPSIRLVGDISFHNPEKYYMVATLEGVQQARNPSSDTEYLSMPSQWIWPKDEWIGFDPWTFTLQGPKVGKLKIQLVMFMDASWPYSDWEGDFGWDGAEIKSGLSEIYLYGDKGPFEVGEDAQVYVRTGFTNGVGWNVRLRPPLTRPGLFPAKTIAELGDDDAFIIPIRIEEGWFIEGELVDNTFIVELWTALFPGGFDMIFTIDDRARAPGAPVVSYALSGSQVIITAVSEATYKNIESFFVWAWYGSQTHPSVSDSQSWISDPNGDEYMPTSVGDNYSVSFSIQAKNFDGTVVVEVVASDTDGRGSTPSLLSFRVEGGGFEPGPTLTQPFLWTPIVYLLIALGLIFGFIVAYYVWITTGSIGMTLFAFLILFGAFGVGAFIAGSVPSIATLMGLSIGGI